MGYEKYRFINNNAFFFKDFLFGCAGSLLLHGLSLVESSGDMGFLLQWLLLLLSICSRACGLL